MNRDRVVRLGLLALVFSISSLGFPILTPTPLQAAGVAYSVGDVFAGVPAINGGLIYHLNSTGTRLDSLDTRNNPSEADGMCFDAAGNLYIANFNEQAPDYTTSYVSKVDTHITLLHG